MLQLVDTQIEWMQGEDRDGGVGVRIDPGFGGCGIINGQDLHHLHTYLLGPIDQQLDV